MITREDIQSFLDRLDGGSLIVKEVEPNLWLARTSDDAEVVVHYAPPVVILRVRVMELPASEPRRRELFRQLLEYNARELCMGRMAWKAITWCSPTRSSWRTSITASSRRASTRSPWRWPRISARSRPTGKGEASWDSLIVFPRCCGRTSTT